MKEFFFKLYTAKIILAALLFTIFVPAAEAQHLTLVFPSDSRRILIPFYATDSRGGAFQPEFVAITNVAGVFNISDTESTPANFFDVSASCSASQNSTVTATASNLNITGQVEISSAGSAVSTQFGSGAASWAGLSEMFIGFTIDQSFAYSLQASTSMNTNANETVPIALVGLDDHGDEWPDIVAYGSTAYPSGVYTAPSAGGTNTGVFTAGTYYFIARVHSMTGVAPGDPPISEHFLATFNLNVTYVQPQPPVIVAFTPNGAGSFKLVCNAPQAGNYRVLSSTNFTTWSELIPSSAWPAGLNTNTVSALPDSNQGFFRIQYLP